MNITYTNVRISSFQEGPFVCFSKTYEQIWSLVRINAAKVLKSTQLSNIYQQQCKCQLQNSLFWINNCLFVLKPQYSYSTIYSTMIILA